MLENSTRTVWPAFTVRAPGSKPPMLAWTWNAVVSVAGGPWRRPTTSASAAPPTTTAITANTPSRSGRDEAETPARRRSFAVARRGPGGCCRVSEAVRDRRVIVLCLHGGHRLDLIRPTAGRAERRGRLAVVRRPPGASRGRARSRGARARRGGRGARRAPLGPRGVAAP